MNQNLEHQKNIAKTELKKLVDNFKEHIESYKASDYNEATLRIDYLNKFFKILGWDVDNNKNLPPSYREVITEDKVQIEGRAKAPDYSFRLENGKRLFFAEAKKPSVNISRHADSAFQLRRYGWSADLPVSILTNFEYFSVYDCTIKPLNSDPVKKAQLKIISYEDYLDEFDYIWDRFSREAILKDSLITYFGVKKKKKGTASVDEDFLKSLDEWRIALAKDISKNNDLDEDQLNFIVQQTIDRIIFLRIAEDRDVEDYGAIQKCLDHEGHYENLYGFFEKADQEYNSGLFKKDELSARVKISDSIISKIIKGLYYPQSPYEFSVLPIEILGKAYEQFLGKKITLTDSARIKIEDKPEVKKAGGVYYTPKYIVDYIVQNTVGKLCEGKTPEQVAKIKILDPASGSGSFLIGAYEYLLQWYKNYFANNPTKYAKKKMFEILTPTGELTTKFKGKVLLDNIYGVDIDTNAVEVTKLSLLLKCMEGETKETIHAQRSFFHERILPTLDDNIKCGNSLIDFDIYAKFPDWSEDNKIRRKINAFNWKNEFKSIFKDKGFNVVIGNPPYVRQELISDLKPYLKLKYSVYNSIADIYVYFFEQSTRLLKKDGFFGMICSNKFTRTSYGKELRDYLRTQVRLIDIVDFGELSVFDGPATFPAIYLFQKKKVEDQNFVFSQIKRLNFSNLKEEIDSCSRRLNSTSLVGTNWTFADMSEIRVFEKMLKNSVPLKEYVNGQVYFGLKTGLNKAFVITKQIKEEIIKEDLKSKKLIKPFVVGDDVRFCKINFKDKYLITIPSGWTNKNSGNVKNKRQWFEKQYPSLFKHLKPFENAATKRGDKGDFWWELRSCDYYSELEKRKIIFPDIAKESRFAFDDSSMYVANTVYFIPKEDFYLLGILNSKLIFAYFKRHASVLGDADSGGRLRWFRQDVFRIPIKQSSACNKDLYTNITNCVKYIIKLNKLATDDVNKKTDREILFKVDELNHLIYRLYELSDEEIALIERSSNVQKR